jgi:hypothetical protein
MLEKKTFTISFKYLENEPVNVLNLILDIIDAKKLVF